MLLVSKFLEVLRNLKKKKKKHNFHDPLTPKSHSVKATTYKFLFLWYLRPYFYIFIAFS